MLRERNGLTIREQLATEVVRTPGACDDCLAYVLGFAQRQQANQRGRELEAEGRLHRTDGVCVRCGGTKTVSFPRRVGQQPVALPVRPTVLLDGFTVLERVLKQAGYDSVAHAVAAHTVFLHPDTVKQARGEALFPIVRAPLQSARRVVIALPDGRRAWADDNAPPTDAFLWAAQQPKGRDVQFCHVWARSDDVGSYTALWNLCATPAFLAKTTDTDDRVKAALKFRAWELYGCKPAGVQEPERPEGYGSLRWTPFPEPVASLEAVLRARMAKAPKRSTTVAARQLGWLFTGWVPDPTL